MNSIHIIGSRIGGGAENFYARLVNSLAERSRILAITPADSPTSKLIHSDVEQIHLRLRNNYDLMTRHAVRKLAKQHIPTIVQTYMGRATRLTRVPENQGIVHIARLGGYYNLKAYRHAHHLVGNTRGLREYFIKNGVSVDRAHYIGNFVEPIPAPPNSEQSALRQSLEIPEESFIITCAARFHPNKGLPDLLEAFSTFWKNHPEARLILVGDGPMADEINETVNLLGIDKAVLLPGWKDPIPYYHLADVLVSPSRWEPLGNTILEAWACAKPLVATSTMGAKELITPEHDGLITALENPEELTLAFEQLMKHPDVRDSLASNGQQTVLKRFSREMITNEYLHLYQKLLQTK